jgi:hypothetical protein
MKSPFEILVPLGLMIVLAIALMILPEANNAMPKGPTGSGMARPGAVKH